MRRNSPSIRMLRIRADVGRMSTKPRKPFHERPTQTISIVLMAVIDYSRDDQFIVKVMSLCLSSSRITTALTVRVQRWEALSQARACTWLMVALACMHPRFARLRDFDSDPPSLMASPRAIQTVYNVFQHGCHVKILCPVAVDL